MTLLIEDTHVVTFKSERPPHFAPSARYYNGTALQVVTHGAGDSNAIAFRYLGFGKTNVDWFVVGNFEDLKKAMEKKNGYRAPFEPHY